MKDDAGAMREKLGFSILFFLLSMIIQDPFMFHFTNIKVFVMGGKLRFPDIKNSMSVPLWLFAAIHQH